MNRRTTVRPVHAAQRWGLALLLLVYCFLSLAVYTPLHTHGKAGACTLNGFDHQWGDSAMPVIAPWGPELLSWWEHSAEDLNPATLSVAPHSSRAPPASRFFSI